MLGRAGPQVFAVDMLGFGHSEKPVLTYTQARPGSSKMVSTFDRGQTSGMIKMHDRLKGRLRARF